MDIFSFRRPDRYSLGLVLLLGLATVSCTAVVRQADQPASEQLLAEYSMMKKRLPLLEREREVVKKENRQYQQRHQELESRNMQLTDELAVLREEALAAKAAGDQQLLILQAEMQQMAQDKGAVVEAQSARMRALEKELERQRQDFKEQLAKQTESCRQEREKAQQASAKKELELDTQLAVLQKKLAPQEREIASLKLAISEISVQLGLATTSLQNVEKDRDRAVAELESVKTAGLKAAKEYQADLGSTRAAGQQALDEAQAELAAVKIANAELRSKLAELTARPPVPQGQGTDLPAAGVPAP